jgi:hypothetical protein
MWVRIPVGPGHYRRSRFSIIRRKAGLNYTIADTHLEEFPQVLEHDSMSTSESTQPNNTHTQCESGA